MYDSFIPALYHVFMTQMTNQKSKLHVIGFRSHNVTILACKLMRFNWTCGKGVMNNKMCFYNLCPKYFSLL
jgi:hypothetical protein